MSLSNTFNITMPEGYTEHALFTHMRTCMQNEALHDFTIVFKDPHTLQTRLERFSKFSLCLLGDYFCEVTTNMQYVEAIQKELVLEMEGFEAESLLLLFRLVFDGNCTVRNVHQGALLSTLAKRFQLPQKVADTVNQTLHQEVRRLTFVEVEQPLGIDTRVDMQCCMELPDIYKPMVLYYFQEACNTKAFVSLPVKTLCDILADDNLAVDDEQTVLHSVERWLQFNAYDDRLRDALHREGERHGMDVNWDRGSNVLEHRGVRAICASSMGMICAVHEGLCTRTTMLQPLRKPWRGPVQHMLLLREHLIIVSNSQLSITNTLHALPDAAECIGVFAYPHSDAAPHRFVASYFDSHTQLGHIGRWQLQEDCEWVCARVALPYNMAVDKMVLWQQFVISALDLMGEIFATDVHSGEHICVSKATVCGMVVCHRGLVYTTSKGDLIVHELGGNWAHLHTVHLIAPPLSWLVVCGSQIVCGGESNYLWVIDIATFQLHRRVFHGQSAIRSLCHWPGVGVCSLDSENQVALWSRTPVSF